jgi:hypothetical protein
MIQGLLRKFTGVLYDVTVGLLQQYRRTTIDLARIELATYYVKVVKVIRQEVLISILVIFGVVIFANLLGLIQMSILLYAPWSVPGRIVASAAFTITCAIVPLIVILRLFSQRRWMEITRADEMLSKAVGSQRNGDGA